MNTDEINIQSTLLTSLLHDALCEVMHQTRTRCQTPQEPDYIAILSTLFTKQLYHILQKVFPSKSFSVSGVYCHQKPIVDIGCGKKPELGDLLLVYIDKDDFDNRIYNSLLLQAKISSHMELSLKRNETHQLELYKYWPEFTYYRAGVLNSKKRNIVPKTFNDGAQYLMIDDGPILAGLYDYFPMGCAIPDKKIKIDRPFSNELVDFLRFKSGRTFEEANDLSQDDWSKMIWDLLKIASTSSSKRKNLKLSSFPRESTYTHYCTKEMEKSCFWTELCDKNTDTINEAPENGISVILIECLSQDGIETKD